MSTTEQPVAFFIPRLCDDQPSDEVAYERILERATQETGARPRDRRIFRMWSRRGGQDCVTEVGLPDPVHGEIVLAILDLGRGKAYLIHCGRPGEEATAVCEQVGRRVYEITEFRS